MYEIFQKYRVLSTDIILFTVSSTVCGGHFLFNFELRTETGFIFSATMTLRREEFQNGCQKVKLGGLKKIIKTIQEERFNLLALIPIYI